jgi:hypothetical protein
MLRRVVSYKFTDVSETLTASIIIAPMMEAASTPETSESYHETTRRNIPEYGHDLHTRRRVNLKHHNPSACVCTEVLIEFRQHVVLELIN